MMENTTRKTLLQRSYRRSALRYLAVSAFCAVFAAIYEHFSHEVYSNYMIFAFAIPLLPGFVPSAILSVLHNPPRLHLLTRRFWATGIAILTVGSIFQGILEIYGTTSPLAVVYPTVGVALPVLGLLIPALSRAAVRIECL